MTFEAMWRDLAPVGRSARTGGYFRQPFTGAEREAMEWFLEQCAKRSLGRAGYLRERGGLVGPAARSRHARRA